MATLVHDGRPTSWWEEPTRKHWHAWIAAWLGWALELDSFRLKPSSSSDHCLRGRGTSEVGSTSDDRTLDACDFYHPRIHNVADRTGVPCTDGSGGSGPYGGPVFAIGRRYWRGMTLTGHLAPEIWVRYFDTDRHLGCLISFILALLCGPETKGKQIVAELTLA